MNFFKSILLDDPDPPKHESSNEPGPKSSLNQQSDEDRNPDDVAQEDGSADGWNFGGLIKTFATRSESLIETYRRDLEEFGSGLKKETEVIREVASRAVKDLPASLEAGTSAAQGVLDGVLKSTAEIISKETQLFGSDGEPETPETNGSLKSGRYSWFEAQLSAIQSDLNTFCEDPEDVEEYKKWKLGFQLEDKRDEIEGLIGENGTLEGIYEKVVPSVVDHETFLFRYFYRVDKLKQQEKVRANLVKRTISVDDDDDELSWDVDEEEENDGNGKVKEGDGDGDKGISDVSLNLAEGSNNESMDEKERGNFDVNDGDKNDKDVALDEKEVKSDEIAGTKSDEKAKVEESVEGKNNKNAVIEKGESGEKGDVSVMSNQKAKIEEEDLEWDEIEDTGSGDEKKSSTERPHRANPREHLKAEEDDEDLSWDIEDDDEHEPVKS